MLIAVCSQNRREVTGHAGKCRRFRMFTVAADGQVTEQPLLELEREETFHESKALDHPLYQANALIALEMGEGLQRRLQSRNIKTFTTELKEPLAAVAAFLATQVSFNS